MVSHAADLNGEVLTAGNADGSHRPAAENKQRKMQPETRGDQPCATAMRTRRSHDNSRVRSSNCGVTDLEGADLSDCSERTERGASRAKQNRAVSNAAGPVREGGATVAAQLCDSSSAMHTLASPHHCVHCE